MMRVSTRPRATAPPFFANLDESLRNLARGRVGQIDNHGRFSRCVRHGPSLRRRMPDPTFPDDTVRACPCLAPVLLDRIEDLPC